MVVCTYNRADALNLTLEALRRQRNVDFEVVVVNGPSTDHTEGVLEHWAASVIAVHNPEANLSISRNAGIRAASGDLVAFVDDDGIPEFDWLSVLAEQFNDPEVAGAGGCVFDHTGMWYQFRFSAANRLGAPELNNVRPYDDLCLPGAYTFPYLQGTNAMFRRRVLDQVGGFDETFDYYLDETDLCARIVDAGYMLRQVDGAYVHHKFLASSIRNDERVFTRWYPVIKNLTYFGFRHALETDGEAAILAKAAAELEHRVAETDAHERAGRLPPGSARRTLEDGRRAIAEGTARGSEAGTRALPPMQLQQSAIRPFPTLETNLTAPLTVVIVTATYGSSARGGIARFLSAAALELAGRGHEVRVITASPDHDRVDFEEGVWVHRLDVDDADGPLERLVLFSSAAADEVERISAFRPVDAVYGPVWDGEVLHVVRRTQLPVVGFVATPLAVVRGGSPPAPDDVVGQFLDMAEREIFTGATVLHADSHSVVEVVRDHYGPLMPPDRTIVAHLGVPDIEAGRPGVALASMADEGLLDVLYVGRLEHRKGVDVLLRAAELLLPTRPSVRLTLVGEVNPLFETVWSEWLDRIRTEPWSSRVVHVGSVDDLALDTHYRRAGVVVAPSRYESFGLTAVESMRHGCATVVARSGALPELIIPGHDGLVVPPGDPAALALAIDMLASDHGLRHRLGVAGRASFEERFTIALATDRLERILRSAAHRRPHGTSDS